MRLLPDPSALPELEVAGRAAGLAADGERNGVTRRQVLRWGIVGGAAVLVPFALPGCDSHDVLLPAAPTPTALPPSPTATPAPSVLSADERQVLRSVVARILPSDEFPGAIEAGADEYIDRFLSAETEAPNPPLFGGGPFSDRNPYPDPTTGRPSAQFPQNSFDDFLPLTRLQRLSWQARLLGSASVAEFDFNAAIIGPLLGLRDQYHVGLAALQSLSQERFGAAFDQLTAEQQDSVIADADGTFIDLLTGHVLEGMFSAPEYGGNRDRIGWQLIGYDGDSQPLGYAIFDATAMQYRERADKPTSTANPDETFAAFDAETDALMRVLVRFAGQPRFP